MYVKIFTESLKQMLQSFEKNMKICFLVTGGSLRSEKQMTFMFTTITRLHSVFA